jgi:DNA-binding CsgD family transcriptional regulator
MRPGSGWIYVIGFEDSAAVWYYKIGMSSTPFDRIASHQTSVPFPLHLICCFYAEDMADEENSLHVLYEEFRLAGEWFLLSEEQLEEIATRSYVRNQDAHAYLPRVRRERKPIKPLVNIDGSPLEGMEYVRSGGDSPQSQVSPAVGMAPLPTLTEKQHRVLGLRKGGLSLSAIGKIMGISKGRVQRLELSAKTKKRAVRQS